jgi:hypothetical protein
VTDAVTRDDLNVVREELNVQLAGVRADIKDLTLALRDLIRLDGDLKRIEQAQTRIGRQVDDHEDRLRSVEVGGAGHAKTVGLVDKLVEHAASLIIGALIALLLLGKVAA